MLEFTSDDDEILQYARENPGEVSIELPGWLVWVGRTNAPALVYDLIDSDLIRDKAMALASAWSAAELPEDSIDNFWWIAEFRSAGFAVDGELADVPTGGMKLYRGCTETTVCRMAWSSDIDVAKFFAARHVANGRRAGVWSVEAQPDLLLANINDREEAEWLLDSEKLENYLFTRLGS